MGERNFFHLLRVQWEKGKFVCVGLDSDFVQIPEILHGRARIADTIIAFNQAIVDATADVVCTYKPNIAFYEGWGGQGIEALFETVRYIRLKAPEVPVILDAKRADIGNTNKGYVRMFTSSGADAITVNPYFGMKAMEPFLENPDKGVFVLCKTSNPGADEFQNLLVEGVVPIPLYLHIAIRVAKIWNVNKNCGLVVGATYPEDLRRVRVEVGDLTLLLPGAGKQGADVEKAVLAGRDSRNQGFVMNSSSGIIFASHGPDFAEAARRETLKLSALIEGCRQQKGA